MDIDIILEPDLTPTQIAEIAVAAEKLGIRALWSSNFHQQWDSLLALAPAAAATSKILLGPLALSPWEMHPLKMANAMLTLNELTNGRAMVAVSGGGGLLGAMGWRTAKDAEVWPPKNPVTQIRYPDRRVRGVREALDVLHQARSGEFSMGYDGGTFVINRPFIMNWANCEGPLLYSCSNGPMMVKMAAGGVADGIQFSDFTVDMLEEAMPGLRTALSGRNPQPADFRVGNFWAWHMKSERDAGMYEARRELIWRGAVIGREKHVLRKFVNDEDELQIILDNFDNFRKANWTRSGNIEGVPDELVARLIDGLASAGGPNDLEKEIERFRSFRDAGLTEVSLRLHDDPMDALQIIGEHVLPEFS